jgi:aspartyl-tRNA synthetase
MEVARIDGHEGLMRLEEEWLAFVFAEVRRAHGNDIRQVLGVELAVPATPFPRISVEEACTILSRGALREAKAAISMPMRSRS